MPATMDYMAGLPARMAGLPLDPEGRPIPWFVDRNPATGEYDFRVMDSRKIGYAVRNKLCWVCGNPMGDAKPTFVSGPMCGVNRISAEPPSHHDCAVYSATRCPFLTTPRRKRRDKDMPEGVREPTGTMIKRNPGVALVWTAKDFKVIAVDARGVLFRFGPPLKVQWFAEGRQATRQEVLDSINSGLPILEDAAAKDGPEAIAELRNMTRTALALVPA
jgi:hypothetical protein